MKTNKLTIVALLSLIVFVYFQFDISQYLSFASLKNQQVYLNQYYQQHSIQTIVIFFIAYIVVTGISLPGATILTLAAGILFGNILGTVLVSFASTIGASLAFILARYLLRNIIESRFNKQLQTINQGLVKDGHLYLLSLRLIPLFPFFLVNLLMGITRIRLWTYVWISQIGMLPATFIYVNAGTQLSMINSPAEILSWPLILSFSLLGLLPLISKKIYSWIKLKKLYQAFDKPSKFDRNLIVIGAGAGGLVSAYIASAVKAKVTIIEKNQMGGDCLNSGCVPSKALLQSAKYIYQIKQAEKYGCKKAQLEFEFKDIMLRVQRIIKKIAPHDSVERYQALGVEVIKGEASIISPYHVKVNQKIISTRNIIIASGASPSIPEIKGISSIDYLTSDNIWKITSLPKKLLVLGAGPIGCELAQAFSRLGSKVILVQRGKHILAKEDVEFSQLLHKQFIEEGIEIKTESVAQQIIRKDQKKYLQCKTPDGTKEIEFDEILIALGRKANVTGFGLESLNIQLKQNHSIETNALLQTNYPNIYAVGDVTGRFQFTHAAAHQAWYATVNALFGRLKFFAIDESCIPWATFTSPEIARVGINEIEAQKNNIPYEVSTYQFKELDRAIADEQDIGFIKVLTIPGRDKILGACIAGANSAELITEFVTAMRYDLGLNKILSTIHLYPSYSEANKYIAGNWKKAHTSQKMLRLLERFHRWMRH